MSARWAAGLVDEVRDALADHADPIKAEGMRAYMKSEIPYRGVQTPLRRKILRTVSLMQPEHSDHLTFRQAEWRVYLLQHS